MCLRTRLLPLLTAVLVGVVGCGGPVAPKCYPVRGRVEMHGRPVEEAMVVFHPIQSSQGPVASRPQAYTDKEGCFELTLLQPRDGALPGEYAITIELRELKADGDQMVRDGKSLLPEMYRNPATSGFKFTVEPKENEVPVLEVKGT